MDNRFWIGMQSLRAREHVSLEVCVDGEFTGAVKSVDAFGYDDY